MLFNALWLALQWLTQQWVEEKVLSLSLPLSPRSICWKKMSQTPLKVIGLDHHYTFYSMSWGCLGHFCWKIHLFEKIHFIQCTRTKQQSTEPGTPPAGAVPSFCCRYIPVSAKFFLCYLPSTLQHSFLLFHPVCGAFLFSPPRQILRTLCHNTPCYPALCKKLWPRVIPFFLLLWSWNQSHDLWLC